jgi:hypothetical protein
MIIWWLQKLAVIIKLWSPQVAKHNCRNIAISCGEFDTCMVAAADGGDHYI